MRYKHVKLAPWIGNQYGESTLFNGGLLVLGESEYQVKVGQQPSRGDTQYCVKQVINGNGSAFWTKVASLFLGHKPQDDEERARFWHSVAYYNFIQTHAGFGPRVRKTPEMWIGAPEAFKEVLQKHSPNYVVVLGFENWNHRGRHDRLGAYLKAEPPVESKWSDLRQTLFYKTEKGKALAVAVKHPATGFNSGEWHEWLRSAFPRLFRK